MPLYTFQCKQCGERQERVCGIEERPKTIPCINCDNGRAVRILAVGHGGIQCDSANDVKWLKSAEDVIKPQYEKPWESRKDYRECLKRNNLEAAR